ncbi:copper chaperone PCu(A)C [Massilia cavernae]|uniref:Copper chaperone PCu(A)C n=1 Tax=Massilia cavernae TaxID=2320864 RepID=A0A418X771_9BURK|nr:copper chaperone PCu(A)C [Massilia cavernae]RJG08322.1 copper chaperone PCu(A)C [Massilia cavernae]
MKKHLFALAASFAVATSALAQVSVTAPWVRATVPQQRSTGAFMHLQSAKDARLVGVSTPVAGMAQLHKMEMSGDRMKMEQVERIELPAGKGVNLASGGYHIMLMDLKRQLKADEVVPLTIVVEGKDKKRETITLDVPVKPLTFTGPGKTPAMHQH